MELIILPLLKKIYRYIVPYKTQLTLGALAMLIHSFLTVFVVKVFKDLMDIVITTLEPGPQGLKRLTLLSLFLISTYFLKELFYYWQRFTGLRLPESHPGLRNDHITICRICR